MTTLLSGYSRRFISSLAASFVTCIAENRAMDDIGLGISF